MSRTRHRLDLLPLLDVFMVVLFVFATIQEQKLDETTRDVLALADERDATRAELRAREAELERAEQNLASNGEAAELRERVGQLEAALAQVRADAEGALAAMAAGDDALRRQSVLTKLLDRYSVFELEIAGATDDSGAVINRCCYRTDPMSNVWTSCGEIPARPQDRTTWWDDGAGGLDLALRRTKGGNAMTVIRQDERASYRIAARMEELLRDRFAEHQIYDEGVTLVDIHCTQ
ncbi:MAG TPA: hypothetical protein VG755_36655 [Nannocystaceae bacterium]|nr:hypothetical protein [Nannocystaceae bacterium]